MNMDKDSETAQAVHEKVDQILSHGDPAMREMIRDLIFEFHAQVMSDPKSRASMKERMKSLDDKVVKLPLVFRPEKQSQASKSKVTLIEWRYLVSGVIVLLMIFIAPWSQIVSFRDQNAPTKICDIKGNVTNLGEKIYHVPKSKWYEKTHIDEGRGERWFCSEDEARGAGWRGAFE